MTEPTPPGFEPAVADAALGVPAEPEPIAAIAEPESIAAIAEPGTSVPPEAPPHAPAPTEHPWPSDSAADRSPGSGPRRSAVLGYLGALILGVAIGAAGLAIATGALGGGSPSPVPSETPGAAPSEPPAGNTIGRPDAPVTIEVWADYQCPYCRLEDVLFGGAIDREYVTPGIVRVVYRDFAFLGQESIDAAVAARCAGAQDPGARFRFHDALYTFQQGENQGRFARANLLQIAEMAGVPSVAVFTACLDDPAVARAVADETAAGRDAGVTSTPTLLLRGPGGERVVAGFSKTWPTLRDALEAVRVATEASPSPTGSSAP